MKSLEALILLAAILLTVACGNDSPGDSYRPYHYQNGDDGNGWTDDLYNTQVDACVSGASAGSTPDEADLKAYQAYCSCLYKTIRDGYRYSDYQSNTATILATVLQSDAYKQCYDQALGQ